MKILKFGGTSVARPERLDKLSGIVKAAQGKGPVVVVVSALGGVTDQLIGALQAASCGEPSVGLVRELRRRHLEDPTQRLDGASRKWLQGEIDPWLRELERLLDGVALLGEVPSGVRHRVLATGERLSVPRVVSWLRSHGMNSQGVDGTTLLRVRDDAAEPEVDIRRTRQQVLEALAGLYDGKVLVVTGFLGADDLGRTVTLGRGASDLSATVLAAALDADGVEIWTDTDGVFSADPRYVAEAQPLRRLNYGETAALARYGAKVLHPRTLAPVARNRIPVSIRSTFQPALPGTVITETEEDREGAALAVSRVAASRFELGSASGVGLCSRAFGVIERLGVELFTSYVGSCRLNFTVRSDEATILEQELKREMRDAPVSIHRVDDLAAVALVPGQSIAPSLLGDLSRVLERLSIPIQDLYLDHREDAQVAVAVVEAKHADRATLLLHENLVRSSPSRHAAA